MQHTEIKLNSKEIFKGNVFRVTMDQVELENGMTSFREVVHHNGGACILPLTDDDKVLMVRQYRYALKEELWELPAGKLEKDEDPFEAAKRELEEECGVTAEDVYKRQATNIPPHNLREVVSGMIALIDDPEIDLAGPVSYTHLGRRFHGNRVQQPLPAGCAALFQVRKAAPGDQWPLEPGKGPAGGGRRLYLPGAAGTL